MVDNGLSLYGTPLVPPPGTDTRRLSVAYSAARYAVAYLDIGAAPNLRQVKVQLYDQKGAIVGSPIVVSASNGGPPSIVANGSDFAVVWSDTYNGTGVYFATVSPLGSVMTTPKLIAPLNVQSGEVISSIGPNFLVAYATYATPSSLQTVLVSASGTAVGPTNELSTLNATVIRPRLVYTPSGFRIFWSDNRSGKYAIFSRAIDYDGVPSASEVPLTDGTKDAQLWSAASMGAGFVVGYSSFETPSSSWLQQAYSDGKPAASVAATSSSLQFPEVVFVQNGLFVLTGDTVQIRDSALNLIAQYDFATFSPGNIRHSSLHAPSGFSGGPFIAASSTDSSSDPRVVRLFGNIGCAGLQPDGARHRMIFAG